MTEFDTSGSIIIETGSTMTKYRWTDLGLFAQGAASVVAVDAGATSFDQFSPATIKRIIADCTKAEGEVSDPYLQGQSFWRLRNDEFAHSVLKGQLARFPILTAAIDADGKVQFTEARPAALTADQVQWVTNDFGECAHPINYKDPTLIGTVSLDDGEDWKAIQEPDQ